jgi:hypothetical protein
LFEQLGRGAGGDSFGSDEGVRVTVADHLQIEVIFGPTADEHRVQLLPAFLSGNQALHGVGGDALGGVDGGGVAETGWGLNIVGWQPDGAVTSVVSNGQVAVLADMDDGPTVSVFDPVVGSEAESAVVGAGDDHVADTGLVPIR